jgi:cytochrome c-type biogenesis protein CcmH/NrfF
MIAVYCIPVIAILVGVAIVALDDRREAKRFAAMRESAPASYNEVQA